MNKLQLHIAILFLVCLGHFRVTAQQQNSVGYGAEFGQPTIHTANGVGLPDGNSVWIGYFDPGFDVLANADDLEQLLGAWNLYDATTTYTDVLLPGHFYDTGSSTDPVTVNQQIWLWIFKTVDNTTADANLGDVREYGLFTSTYNADPRYTWRFPALGSPPNNVDINTSQVDIARWGSISGGHLNLAAVAPVPEPAVAGLLGLGLLGVIVRFRKK